MEGARRQRRPARRIQIADPLSPEAVESVRKQVARLEAALDRDEAEHFARAYRVTLDLTARPMREAGTPPAHAAAAGRDAARKPRAAWRPRTVKEPH